MKTKCPHEKVIAVRKSKFRTRQIPLTTGIQYEVGDEIDVKLHFYCSECKKKLDPSKPSKP